MSKAIIEAHNGAPWSLPIFALTIIVLLTAVATYITVKIPVKRIREVSIIDTINQL